MDWQTRRKFLYAIATIITVAAIAVFFLKDALFPHPTCFDGKKNGYEVGLDCGGECNKMCTQEVIPLAVVWARAIPVAALTYDIVGLVSNRNIDNASKQLGYSFTLFNRNGDTIKTLTGTTIAPLDGEFPIIIQNVIVPEEVARTELLLSDGDHYKVKESPTSPTVRVSNRRYEGGSVTRVYATISNTKRIEIRDLEVSAILFDRYNNAYAVGKTVVPILNKEESKELVFIWNNPLKEEPTQIDIYPFFSPFDALP